MLLSISNIRYKKCYIRLCFVVLVLITIKSWWFIYHIHNRSNILRSFFGILSSNCIVYYPDNSTLQFANTYWQILNTSKSCVYIFGAYIDVRNKTKPLIRFTTMFDKLVPKVRLYAQVWSNPNDVQVSFTRKCEFLLMWHLKWGTKSSQYPFLVSCTLPDNMDYNLIRSVSLVENICDTAHNRIAVHRGEEKGTPIKEFGVCVKGLNLADSTLTLKLIEWIEMIHLLGAYKIHFYELHVQPQLMKLLKYYSLRNKVDVVPIRHTSQKHRNNLLAKRHNEMVVYNDCFYRHHAEYKYIVLLDIDELILPTTTSTWQHLFSTLNVRFKAGVFSTINSICVRNIYFLDEFRHAKRWFRGVPRHMHMLQHVYRQKNFTRVGYYTKCFHATRNTIVLHNHFSFACEKQCLYHHLDVKLAQLNHYRNNCHNGSVIDCDAGKKHVVMDFGMWRYKDTLMENVQRVVRDLELN